jgi:hypothetical protein
LKLNTLPLRVEVAVAVTTQTVIIVAVVVAVLAVIAQVFLVQQLAVAVQPKAH